MSDKIELSDCIWKEGLKPNGQINWKGDISNLKEYIESNYKNYTSMKNMCDVEDIPYNVIKIRIDKSSINLDKDSYAWKNIDIQKMMN
jgi:hypothetical protein